MRATFPGPPSNRFQFYSRVLENSLLHRPVGRINYTAVKYKAPVQARTEKSKVKWTLEYPKEKDLVWDKSSVNGRERLDKMPHIDGDMTEYNSKNVNAHRGTLEAFL